MGRKREMDELRAGLEMALGRRGRFFLIAGEPGIGKTRLADETANEAKQRGFLVAWGRCWEAGGAPAFWPWTQVIRSCSQQRDSPSSATETGPAATQLLREIGGLLGESAGSRELPGGSTVATALAAEDPAAERFRLFDTLARLLAKAASATPLLIILDDIHAADVDSLLFLRFIAREIRQGAILLVATYRETEVRLSPRLSELVSNLGREADLITLRGVSEAESAQLIELAAGHKVTPRVASSLYRATEGNPFFLNEIVRLLATEGRLDRPDPGLGGFRLPDSVRAAIRRRLSLLGEPARSALTLASVIGREFDLAILGRLSDLPHPLLVDALSEASACGLVVESRDRIGCYHFSHMLVSEALYHDLPSTRRQQLHQLTAQALEEMYRADPELPLAEIAHHWLRALPSGPAEKAVNYALRAAERARDSFANEQAAQLYQMALQALNLLPTPDPHRRCELLLALGESRYRAGDARASKESFVQAAALARELGDDRALARASLGCGLRRTTWGIVDQGLIAMLEEALSALGTQDNALRAMVLARLAFELHWSDDWQRKRLLGRQAVELAHKQADPYVLIQALHADYLAEWGPDTSIEDRLAASTELLRLARECGARGNEWALRARYLRLINLLELGDLASFDAGVEEYARAAEELGLARFCYAPVARAARAIMEGRFEEGEKLSVQAFEQGLRDTVGLYMHSGQLFMIRREQGRLAELELGHQETSARFPALTLVPCALALCHAEAGAIALAGAEFDRLAADDFAIVRRDASWLSSMVLLADVCTQLKDSQRAQVLYNRLLPYASHVACDGLHRCFGSVAQYLGMLATTMSRFDEAQAHFEAAIAMNQRMRARPWVARSQREYAAMLLARGGHAERENGIERLEEAIATASSLGMPRFERLARELLDNASSVGAVAGTSGGLGNFFRQEGEFWSLGYHGRVLRLRGVRGLDYVAQLLRHPGKEFHALDLAAGAGTSASVASHNRDDDGERGGEAGQASAANAAKAGLHSQRGLGDAGEMLDARAKAEYRHKRDELRDELEEAKELGQIERQENIEEQIEALTKELSRAVGLHGRDRRAASAAERARLNVTRAIKLAIDKIAAHDAELGRLLSRVIKTGTFCSYVPDPDHPLSWEL